MDSSINSKFPPSYSGVNITCNVIDPTKLPPDSPLLQAQPQCTVTPPPQQPCGCYPGNYYINNYGNGGMPPMYPPYPPYPPQTPPAGDTKKKRIQTINDQYIKNLEQFLNSPSEDYRKMAAQEVLKRLDEDRTRYNDAALNALINKMLQDPTCHKVKATALTALETQLAQGNDNTVKILQNMAQNDKSRNGADAATAANILLKMSSPTKLIDVPKGSTNKGIVD